MISRSAAHLEREFERHVLLALDRAVEQASKMCDEMEDELRMRLIFLVCKLSLCLDAF